ncbi:protein-tyrosine phosphatase-like protein [Mucor mucedo]|uniref:protein-tyrosine phosphatase-like protein n=1 Tax=Mucor mucedo TaxID=29922 RepID=UPI00221E6FA4|nr:protein-tyrosine phosphatase-like protein [Mucor mucedo]KAI7889771.1 protein-tyrosine phosphatase-like protein [Mucor mucedo]
MTNLKKNPKRLALNLSSTSQKPASLLMNKEHQFKNDLYQKGPACILPNLYLGSYYNALNVTQLNQLNINCIINVASEIHLVTPTKIDYHHMHWTHRQNNLARAEFAHAISKIQTAHSKKQNVLIHCQQGIERSAALVVAFLLCTSRLVVVKKISSSGSSCLAGQNWSLDRALDYVQERAPGIRPNMELLYELREFEKQIVPTRHNIQTRTRRSESITCLYLTPHKLAFSVFEEMSS